MVIRYGVLSANQLVAGEPPTPELIEEKNTKFNFYNNLLHDVASYGILNPVIATSGDAPDPFLKFVNGRDIIITHGNSRLWAANHINCSVPFILNDWHGDMYEYEQIVNYVQFESYFATPPCWVDIDKNRGLQYGPLHELQQLHNRQWRS
ncbi:MAG: hypothetical protein HC836_40720 [Richelia sp. RM2_1_2]|nr:hypothetical protein [Richelia sp. RM2_1_2]